MKSVLRLILILGVFLSANTSIASHVAGGDFQYTCVGPNQFLITLNIFRDCSGVSAPTSAPVTFTSPCGTFTQTLTLLNPGGTEVSQLCPSALVNSTCNGGNLPGMQQYIFQDTVTITPPCNMWEMSWSLCCRNGSTNLTGSTGDDMFISAGMNSATDNCNNSPQYTAQPIPYVCQNQLVNYNFGVVESQGDSLVYSLVTALDNATTPVTYNTGAGYSAAQPFSTTNPVVLNQSNGQLTFTPTTTGLFVVVVRVDEYDPITGDHLGYVFRDIQIVVEPCNNQVPQVGLGGITNFSGSGTQLDSNSVAACIGDTVDFTINFIDPDTLDTLFITHNIFDALDSTAIVTTTSNGDSASIHINWIAQPGNGSFVSFNVTAEDDACNVSGLINAAFDIIIYPSTYAGETQTICQGTQSAFIQATGGSAFNWSVISGDPISPTNFTCTTCDTTTASPNVTTTYQVISNLVTGCTNIDTIVVEVAPDFTLTMPNDTIICSVDNVPLTASTDQPYVYSYSWTPSTTLNNVTSQTVVANPSQPTTYNVTVSSSNGCVKSGDVSISLSPPFPENNFISGDSIMCFGEPNQLTLNFGETNYQFCGLTTMGCLGTNTDGVIGTGVQTSSNTLAPTIWGGDVNSSRNQFLYTAADLQAMGMTNGGQINSIAFDIATVGAVTQFTNFSVKMKCTSSSDLSNGWENNLVEVIPSYTHTVVSGWNTLTFPTPYYWDGVSNLVFEVCYNNLANVLNTNSQHRFTSTVYQSVRYATSNFQSTCNNGALFSQTSNARPNIQINYCTGADPGGLTYQWTPSTALSSTTIQNPITTTTSDITYQVIFSDTLGGCTDTVDFPISVVTEYDASFSFDGPYCETSTPDNGVPVLPGGTWSGPGITDAVNGTFDPSIAGIGSHPINYFVPGGNCANDTTILVNVIPPADDSVIAPAQVCPDGGLVDLVPINSGGVFAGISINAADSTFDPSIGPGTYNLTYSLTTPCPTTGNFQIIVLDSIPFGLTPNASICDNETMILLDSVVVSPGFTEPTLISFNGTGITNTTNGTFDANGLPSGNQAVTVNVTDTAGFCGATQTININVKATEYVSFTNDTYCSGDNNESINTNLPLNNAVWSNTPADPNNIPIVLDGFNKFNPEDYGPGTWIFDFTYTNGGGCVGESTDEIYILLTPDAPVAEAPDVCVGDSVQLSSSFETVSDSIYWLFTYEDSTSTDSVYVSGTPISSYGPAPLVSSNASVVVVERNGVCTSEPTIYQLPIKPTPETRFIIDFIDVNGIEYKDSIVTQQTVTQVRQGDPVWFRGQKYSSNLTTYWDFNWQDISGFGDIIVNDAGNVPETPQDFRSPGLYQTLLIYQNEFGCESGFFTTLEVVGTEAIPNIFTPNGDGINDLFYIVAPVRDFTVTIFNRWGQEVYSYNCNQCNQREKGWDGSNSTDGTYFFIATGVNPDGSDYVQKGTVTLTGSNN